MTTAMTPLSSTHPAPADPCAQESASLPDDTSPDCQSVAWRHPILAKPGSMKSALMAMSINQQTLETRVPSSKNHPHLLQWEP